MSEQERPIRQIDYDRYQAFIEEFRGESDRAAVILGAAKIDLLLYQILEAYLLPSPSGKDELLDGEAPLSTFSSKINIAHRLCLIDGPFARMLHLIRKVRNSFAHEVSGCTLSSGSHSDRVKEMSLPLRHMDFYIRFKGVFFPNDSSPSADFRATLAVVVARLEHFLLHINSVKQPFSLPLINPSWKEIVPDNVEKNA